MSTQAPNRQQYRVQRGETMPRRVQAATPKASVTGVSEAETTNAVQINVAAIERAERLRVTLAGIERWEAEHGLGQDDV